VDSILGLEEHEDEWFVEQETESPSDCGLQHQISDSSDDSPSVDGIDGENGGIAIKRQKQKIKLPLGKEKEKARLLDTTGDICGGRGGELGRRLEAWLSVNGNVEEGLEEEYFEVGTGIGAKSRWEQDEKAYEAEAE
jgi:hypothetical protein